MLYRVGFFCLFFASLFSVEHVYLKTPDLSRENLIEVNVGIRPFRKTGVRLEPEWFQDKLIVHNYGYGGSGITLSFGGAKIAHDIIRHHNPSIRNVAILGAGVIGLTTAYELLEKGYKVCIYSESWSPDLTSNVAPGIWSPLSFPEDMPQEKKILHQKLLQIAESRFLKSLGDNPEFKGIRKISSYNLKVKNSKKEIKAIRRGEEVAIHFDNGVIKRATRMHELGIDGKLFMEDLFLKVKEKGGHLEQRRFENLEEILNLEESVIVNCTSTGSQKLFNDQEFIPIRGHLIYFKPQEGIDYLLYQNVPNSNYWVSIYPWSDRLIVGGVYEKGEEELAISFPVMEKIIENAEKCLSGTL